MISTRNQRKWRHFMVNPSFQLHLMLIHVFFLILMTLLMALVLFQPFYRELNDANNLWVQYVSAEFWLHLLERGALVLGGMSVISGLYHIVFSHRLCGPLVNMNHTFDALSRGNTTRLVHLRQNDFLKYEAEKINLMLIAIDDRISRLKTSQDELMHQVRRLPAGCEKEELRTTLEKHQALLDQWKVSANSKYE
jgi:hypothetical protein